jgi:hypothetical protein
VTRTTPELGRLMEAGNSLHAADVITHAGTAGVMSLFFPGASALSRVLFSADGTFLRVAIAGCWYLTCRVLLCSMRSKYGGRMYSKVLTLSGLRCDLAHAFAPVRRENSRVEFLKLALL